MHQLLVKLHVQFVQKKQTNKQTQITNNNKKVMQKRGLHEVLPKLQFKENYRKSSIKSR